MKISYTHDTETGKSQVFIVGAAYDVKDTPAADGSKFLVFGHNDDRFDVVSHVGPEAAKKIAAKLLTQPASEIVQASVSDIATVRGSRKD